MTTATSPRKIILAIDAAAEEPELLATMARALEPFLRDPETVVQPVSVLRLEGRTLEQYIHYGEPEYLKAVRAHIEATLRASALPRMRPPVVIPPTAVTTRSQVKALLEYAEQESADLIALASHSRKGLPRLFLGSFAETLTLKSSIPLFIVNPRTGRRAPKREEILFPTDFSAESRDVLREVCALAHAQHLAIVLFHQFELMTPIFGDPLLYATPELLDEDFAIRRRTGERWCTELKADGIDCRLLMNRHFMSPAEATVTLAKRRGVRFIAMASRSGAVAATILGSVARQVVRAAPCPVWIVHPQPDAATQPVRDGARLAAV